MNKDKLFEIKNLKTFFHTEAGTVKAVNDVSFDIFKGEGDDASRKDYVKGKGWYEWPISHIPVLLLVSLVGITITFATQFGFLASFIFSLVLCLTTFALGAIAVKVIVSLVTSNAFEV